MRPFIRIIRAALLASAFTLASPLPAQDAASWRGAWTADIGGTLQVLYLVAQDGATDSMIGGTWCHDCANADYLAFVDDGTIDSAGLHFNLYSSSSDGSNSVRGLVCGPCDNPHNFAPLENVRIDGTRFTFDIVHEDNGFGFAQHGPFRNVTSAQIARNEMQMTTYASYEPEGPRIELTLLGPVRYMPEVQR